MSEVNSILIIAQRDLLKFLRDRLRIVSELVFPIVIIAALGGSLQASIGRQIGYDFVIFTMTGVLAQTLFQSSAFGIISLIEDRQNDFSQEIFVSPVSRYAIIFGKICGESMVALAQGVGIMAFAVLYGIPFTAEQVARMVPTAIVICLFGGSFGVLLMANIRSQRAASQVFPFIFLPQYFLGGVFSPIQNLPLPLEIGSRISPLRYAVDLMRGAYYSGTSEFPLTVLDPPLMTLALCGALFALFMVIGTWMFARAEANR